MGYPELKSRVGKKGAITMPEGDRLGFEVLDEVRVPQSDLPGKILCLELVEFEDGRRETRLGYYVIGKKLGKIGKWVWGQYAPFMPLEDLRMLVAGAEERNWFKTIQEGVPRSGGKQ
ncbi:MAG TPA: hypothetical protein VIA62_03055 [Thermoanaerobaculia bacterium]|nr:hypothetical protein [Thermoanaerobaculia bacterium]